MKTSAPPPSSSENISRLSHCMSTGRLPFLRICPHNPDNNTSQGTTLSSSTYAHRIPQVPTGARTLVFKCQTAYIVKLFIYFCTSLVKLISICGPGERGRFGPSLRAPLPIVRVSLIQEYRCQVILLICLYFSPLSLFFFFLISFFMVFSDPFYLPWPSLKGSHHSPPRMTSPRKVSNFLQTSPYPLLYSRILQFFLLISLTIFAHLIVVESRTVKFFIKLSSRKWEVYRNPFLPPPRCGPYVTSIWRAIDL